MGSRGAERDVACFALVTRPPGSTITNRAGSGGKGASRAALSVNGPTYVSRDTGPTFNDVAQRSARAVV